MESRPASLFLVLLLPVLFAAASRTGALPGGWAKISNVSDPHVEGIGKFAVAEYNKQSKGGLEFKAVVSGESQVVAGMNYRLVVEAAEGGSEAKYEAVVYEREWENHRELTSFKPVA